MARANAGDESSTSRHVRVQYRTQHPGNQIASALGILTAPTTETVAAQPKLGIDLAEHNADGGLTLPMPTTVVVDATGVIRWIDVHPNYTTRSEVPDILAAVDAVR
jgi:alkyl hydroperoxide reductase subunit AhpC